MKETLRFHRDKPLKTPEEVSKIENLERQIGEQETEIANMEEENEQIQERMSLRDRVKAIFKKYGFTAFAVVSAVGVVISVIVSNLSKGLSKLGKGVGDGLKNIGKKLGEILPGMVGAIVSFLFKTAGRSHLFPGKECLAIDRRCCRVLRRAIKEEASLNVNVELLRQREKTN